MSQTREMQHSDSAEVPDSAHEEGKKVKSRRPANTAFRQQRLKAWQPILTPKTVLPLFFAIGIIFAPIGGLLIWTSEQVQEISIDYTNCIREAPSISFELAIEPGATGLAERLRPIPTDRITRHFRASGGGDGATWGQARGLYNYSSNVRRDTNICIMDFQIEDDLQAPVLFYYRLTNFYQNHRRYVKSLDVDQLRGNARSSGQIARSECDPLTLDLVEQNQSSRRPIYPCGLIANSMFNDTFVSPLSLNPRGGGAPVYNMTDRGIAWDSDRDLYVRTTYQNGDVVPPPNWMEQYPNGYTEDRPIPNIQDWEAFHVWMRTAALPTFSKLALRNDNDVMTAGRYRVAVWDRFPVTQYGGTKSILISTRTVMGGRNPFLGIAYIAVGGICIIMGALFTATHLIKPRKLGDHTYLTWNNEQPSTATATGRNIRHGD